MISALALTRRSKIFTRLSWPNSQSFKYPPSRSVLDERREFDPNRSIMPDTASVEKIYGGLQRGSSMVVGMIDYGTCGLSRISPCKESYLDGMSTIIRRFVSWASTEMQLA